MMSFKLCQRKLGVMNEAPADPREDELGRSGSETDFGGTADPLEDEVGSSSSGTDFGGTDDENAEAGPPATHSRTSAAAKAPEPKPSVEEKEEVHEEGGSSRPVTQHRSLRKSRGPSAAVSSEVVLACITSAEKTNGSNGTWTVPPLRPPRRSCCFWCCMVASFVLPGALGKNELTTTCAPPPPLFF